MNTKNIDTIIWDWNGTLLNDIDICLSSINKLLIERGLSSLNKNDYKDIFTFPVKEYYKKAGFDFQKEPFDDVAVGFMNLYHQKLPEAKIFDNVEPLLKTLQDNNFKQIMVSAMEHNSLITTVKEKGIYDYFDRISGIGDIFAHSKIENARAIVKELNLNPETICLIGDTIHDYEVAMELGTCCLLVSNGHQSFHRLSESSATIVKNLEDISHFFQLNHVDLG